MTDNPFAGRTAVITGAGAGIGAALATELAARGMSLVLADIDEVGVRRMAAELCAKGFARSALASM